MAKTRSPAYPAISLPEAIERVRDIYNEDYQNRLPRVVAATHMGYTGLNGKSLGVLSALMKYGLLEGRGDDTRVSDRAVTIIAHPQGAPERVQAIKEAAAKPDLFAELDAQYQNGKASDASLRAYLLTKKFIPTAADAAIRAYRETKALVENESAGYDSGSEIGDAEEPTMEHVSAAEYQAGATAHAQKAERDAKKVADLTEPYEISIQGTVITGIRLLGRFHLKDPADVDELIQILNANKTLMRPRSEPESEN